MLVGELEKTRRTVRGGDPELRFFFRFFMLRRSWGGGGNVFVERKHSTSAVFMSQDFSLQGAVVSYPFWRNLLSRFGFHTLGVLTQPLNSFITPPPTSSALQEREGLVISLPMSPPHLLV